MRLSKRKPVSFSSLSLLLAALLVFAVSPLRAQQAVPAPETTGAAASSAQQPAASNTIQELEQAIEVRDEAIRNLQDRVAALEKAVTILQERLNGPQPPTTAASHPPRPTTPKASAASQEYQREERLAQAALDRALISRGGLLVPPWTVEIENGVTYYNSSSDTINIDGFAIFPVLVVGDIESQHIRRDVVLPTFTARLGLPKDFQFDICAPYGYEIERTTNADNTETVHRAFGLGDIQLGLTKQLTREQGWMPNLLADFQWKTTTGHDPFRLQFTQPALGTGFNSLQGTLTAVKSSDPMVFFGGISYAANLSTTETFTGLDPSQPDQAVRGRINPGDTAGFELGSALALNPQASLSFAWQQAFTNESSLNGRRIPGSFFNEGIFQVGGSYVYAPGRAVDVGLGIGLTRDVPDFQFTVGFPLRFHLTHKPR